MRPSRPWLRALLWSLPGPLRSPARKLRRTLFLPSADEILSGLDTVALQSVRETHAPGLSDSDLRTTRKPVKYLDPSRQLHRNLRRADDLDLFGRPPLRILDLGCGPGYFVSVCSALGHDACGFDLDENPIFRDLVAAQGVRRFVGRIEPGRPIPLSAQPFDLITAFAICFNNHHGDTPWGPSEWIPFLEDCALRLLAPQGSLVLKFNPRNDSSTFFSEDVLHAFLARKATIAGPTVCLTRSGILHPGR